MFQKFFTDTIMNKFIKGLLSNTNIPLYKFVSLGDPILEGCLYIYDHWIIQCTATGNIQLDDAQILYPSAEIFPTFNLFPGGGVNKAGFKVLAHYNPNDPKYNYKFKSNIYYYDSETHYHLGNYLRYLRDKEGLNLLPYYNCYNYASFESLSLDTNTNSVSMKVKWISKPKRGYKLAAIPIKFNQPYTIAIDCPTEVTMRAVIYGPQGMIKETLNGSKYYSDYLNGSGNIYPNLRFNSPIIYSVGTEYSKCYQREKYLYLLIQLPSDNTSGIVILEGDYSKSFRDTIYYNDTFKKSIYNKDEDINKHGLTPTYKNYNTQSQYSLLTINPHESFAFSDRLIEYLLQFTICNKEELTNNIVKVQDVLYKLDSQYRYLINSDQVSYGVWDEYIPERILVLMNQFNTFEDMKNEQLRLKKLQSETELYLAQITNDLTNPNLRPTEIDAKLREKEAIWNELQNIKNQLKLLNKKRIGVYMCDMDGNINKDVEEFFLRYGGAKIDE